MNVKGKGCELDSTSFGQGPVTDTCEHGNTTSVSIKDGEFLGQLSNYQLLKEDSALRS
jgi:hypothetical protein